MHSNSHLSGKAFIIIRPSLFFTGLMLSFCLTSAAMNPGTIHKTDSGSYVCQLKTGEDSIELTWKRLVNFASALKFPEKIENSADVDELNREIVAPFGFYLYKQTAFLKQVDGIITAELQVILKKDELTAIVGNILFTDYARDRYGKYSPSSSKKYALTDLQRKKKNNEIWQHHFSTIDEKMNLLLAEMIDSISDEKVVSGR